ncbi:Dictyostelium Slime mold-like repeat protein [Nitzschia inconspicua]|uniref:Dictyostelium Slime mold-like repeat protein n=1 Tax=Nitzschia inconspicua TaxID=303405 RepID=A0A9K3M4Q5_9STRA|nr:Dictyostelium Slime mold-like repeat protein [Nitzschia inconspicua]
MISYHAAATLSFLLGLIVALSTATTPSYIKKETTEDNVVLSYADALSALHHDETVFNEMDGGDDNGWRQLGADVVDSVACRGSKAPKGKKAPKGAKSCGKKSDCEEKEPPCGGSNCDDGNLCTIDFCHPIRDVCVNEPVICEDNESCDTTTGTCEINTEPPCGGSDCDDDNLCTRDFCDTITDVCVNEAIQCEENEACDVNSGTCQDIQTLVPCVAVIDEWDSRDYSVQWEQFRTEYPRRPFCLLVPNIIVDFLPPAFETDTLSPDGIDRTIVSLVNRDDGDAGLVSDWFNICGLGVYSSSSISFIGLFIDESGSMTLDTVRASYNKFISDLTNAGFTFQEVNNDFEEWVDPFLTTLAPPASGAAGAVARHKPLDDPFLGFP